MHRKNNSYTGQQIEIASTSKIATCQRPDGTDSSCEETNSPRGLPAIRRVARLR